VSEGLAWLLLFVLVEWHPFALAASCFLTALHAAEEVLGEGGPLWDYFSDEAGVYFPAAGALAVCVALPSALAAVATLGYVGCAGGSGAALSALCGARLGDALFSHWGPALFGRLPNPGLYSSALCAGEGGLLLWLARVDPVPALAAAAPFALTWPALWLARVARARRA
jgi:hypothetical protein